MSTPIPPATPAPPAPPASAEDLMTLLIKQVANLATAMEERSSFKSSMNKPKLVLAVVPKVMSSKTAHTEKLPAAIVDVEDIWKQSAKTSSWDSDETESNAVKSMPRASTTPLEPTPKKTLSSPQPNLSPLSPNPSQPSVNHVAIIAVLVQPQPRGEPGDPSGPGSPGGPGGPGGPRSPISPNIPNEQCAMLELLSGFKGSIETLGTVLATLGRPSDRSESKSKVKEPEVFDGSDPRKLKMFFINLALVDYTLSYLSESAKEWFVPDILDPDLNSLPAWTSSFKALVKELQDNFGVYDAQGEAEDSLGNLKMKETKNIRKYCHKATAAG
ncbi:MAG: hypothetical protein NXY57DRAFT_1113127 [Lentinula lateritia]|nr:MAG: hypothetical protein NXY57DRAFT_1113127 [Lentinula lateritia]